MRPAYALTLALALLCAGAAVPALGQSPRRTEDPHASDRHARRGSSQEKERFKGHRLSAEKEGKRRGGKGFQPSAEGEVQESLAPGERPSLRFLKKRGRRPSRTRAPGAERLENTQVRDPNDFVASYDLSADAEVSVSVMAADGSTVRRFQISAGAPGARSGSNSFSCWDGQDSSGGEAPSGMYQAFISIRYAPGGGQEGGKTETKVIPLNKR